MSVVFDMLFLRVLRKRLFRNTRPTRLQRHVTMDVFKILLWHRYAWAWEWWASKMITPEQKARKVSEETLIHTLQRESPSGFGWLPKQETLIRTSSLYALGPRATGKGIQVAAWRHGHFFLKFVTDPEKLVRDLKPLTRRELRRLQNRYR